jgi:galactose mutarotase-like enzyme
MTAQTITLIDLANGIYTSNAVVDAQSSGVSLRNDEWNVRLTRMQGGLSDGVDLICLDNGHMKLMVLPTRGMGIWKAECGDLPLKWDSPVVHPVHPSLVDQSRRGGIGWLDGFNELLCRCGLGWHGAPGTDTRRDDDGNVISEQFLPLHGRIANLPAHKVSVEIDDAGQIRVTGVIDETSVFGERLRLTSVLSTQAGSSDFEIHDTVTNLGGGPAEVEMLYHCNFGMPLLGGGATFHTAASRVTPRDARAAEGINDWETFGDPTSGYAEQVYFVTPLGDDFGRAMAVLRSADGQAAVGLRFDTSTLPWFTLWKNTQAAEDGYCCGLEPSSSLPNNRQFEREHGRVVALEPGNSIDFRFQLQVATDSTQVDALVTDSQQRQKQAGCVVDTGPSTDLSPV